MCFVLSILSLNDFPNFPDQNSRPISKEEKEKENKNKSSPIKQYGRAVPGQVHFVDNRLCDGVTNRLYNVRHHLERTTGPGETILWLIEIWTKTKPKKTIFQDVEEGALLPSPTREKLIPTIPKSKDEESYNSQRGSPKKSATSRHGSPQKGSPQKSSSSPKKVLKQSKGTLWLDFFFRSTYRSFNVQR